MSDDKFVWGSGDIEIEEEAVKAFDLCEECVAAKACKYPTQDSRGRFTGCRKGSGGMLGSPDEEEEHPLTYDEANDDDPFFGGDEFIPPKPKKIEETYAGLTEAEEDALAYYTSDFYVNINQGLRHGFNPDNPNVNLIKQRISDLDSVVAKTSFPQDQTVYRGIHLGNVSVGDVIHDKGFVSTSTKESTASKFKGETGAVVAIKAKQGQKAKYIKATLEDAEDEVLLPRGTAFRITGEDKSKPYRMFTAEVVDE